MTNEELAILIQQGRDDLVLDLWESVRRFAYQQVRRLCRTPDFDDGMQSAFVAMMNAVATYRVDKQMSFIGWFSLSLKLQLYRLNGWTWRKDAIQADGTRKSGCVIVDALNRDCASLDEPIGDDTGTTLCDMIADNTDYDALIARKELHDTIDYLLRNLPKDSEDVLRKVFFDGIDLSSQAKERGTTIAKVTKMYQAGMRELRRNHRALDGFR